MNPPTYTSPPLDEVACGVRFEAPANLRLTHFGLLWESVKADFPIVQHAPPIVQGGAIAVDETTGAPLPRLWFVSQDDSRLYQIQLDRFLFNWRRRDAEYPRYGNIVEAFLRGLDSLQRLLSEAEGPPLKILDCELTYVNVISADSGWTGNKDLSKIFRNPIWVPDVLPGLPPPSAVRSQLTFPLPEDRGSLSVQLKQGHRNASQQSVLILELTAKGLPPEGEPLAKWFDLAHDSIALAFSGVTTEDVQTTVWGRQ